MSICLLSVCFFLFQPNLGETYQVLKRTDHQFSASQGSLTCHVTVSPEQDQHRLHFEEQDRFLEVTYLGKPIREVVLRTNFSGELVTQQFVYKNQALLATEEAWHFLNDLEPEARPLFEVWHQMTRQERGADIGRTHRRGIEDKPKCTGPVRFGIGSDPSFALDNLAFNCTNTSCAGCCRYFGCRELSVFFWICEGRSCEENLSVFP